MVMITRIMLEILFMMMMSIHDDSDTDDTDNDGSDIFEMGLMTAIAMVKNNIHNSERNIDDVDRDYNNDRDDDLRNSDYVYDDITYISIQGRHQNQFSQW